MPSGYNFNLERLRQILELGKVGNFARAAHRLGIGQPTLSQNVRKLEEEFKFPLFHRHSTGVVLTAEGRVLAEQTDQMLAAAGRFDGALSAVSAKPATYNKVRMGLPDSISSVLFPDLLGIIRDMSPAWEIQIYETPAKVLEESLVGSEFDVALTYDPPNSDLISSAEILEEELCLISSPSSQYAARASEVSLKEIAKLPLIMPSFSHSCRRSLAKAGAKHALSFNPIIESDNYHSISNIVHSGFGHTVASNCTYISAVRSGRLVSRRIVSPSILTSLKVCVPARLMNHGSPEQAAIAAVSTVRNLVSSGMWPTARLPRP